MHYGVKVPADNYARERSIIGNVETTVAGNIILRIGREHPTDGTWHQTEHVVLTRDEAVALGALLSGDPMMDEHETTCRCGWPARTDTLCATHRAWMGHLGGRGA